eukprot:CAMPEP_0202829468 /NCGR_PEP_ID=MMETSP1389-20130828/15539_1 /ASSEMBLY_ACC=CAM_ASM_000865 /TAXON_ID=302021 /ORGANISM="Rhodomonas sp., Strain CCMP768" /LENGTH=104 /DNA_ID=CAMNT_0049503025 /DNA_START=70 /DNA_END=380 /DNA_ORIENTATION=+
MPSAERGAAVGGLFVGSSRGANLCMLRSYASTTRMIRLGDRNAVAGAAVDTGSLATPSRLPTDELCKLPFGWGRTGRSCPLWAGSTALAAVLSSSQNPTGSDGG